MVNSILEEARKNGASCVKEVELELGELCMVEEEHVKSIYELLAKGTLLENSSLLIRKKKAVLECRKCGSKYGSDTLLCRCGGYLQILEGKECVVKRIEIKR